MMRSSSRLQKHLCLSLEAALNGGQKRPPEAGITLWNCFMQLSRTRTHHLSGPNPVSYQEVEAFCRMTQTPLEPHHVSIITAMDEVWLKAAAAKKSPEGVKTLRPSSKQPLSAALLDAMLG